MVDTTSYCLLCLCFLGYMYIRIYMLYTDTLQTLIYYNENMFYIKLGSEKFDKGYNYSRR